MGFPLLILSIGSIFLGYLTRDLFIGLGTPFWNNSIFILPSNLIMFDSEFIPIFIKWVPVVVSILASGLSIFIYNYFSALNFSLSKVFLIQQFYIFLNRKWFFDRIQNESIVKTVLQFGYNTSYKSVDKGIIELLGPKGFANLATSMGSQVVALQSGFIHFYIFFMFVGIILLIFKILLWPSLVFSVFDIPLFFIIFVSTLLISVV
jgi:NADH-ubiquinone oxidoreductase chain 5